MNTHSVLQTQEIAELYYRELRKLYHGLHSRDVGVRTRECGNNFSLFFYARLGFVACKLMMSDDRQQHKFEISIDTEIIPDNELYWYYNHVYDEFSKKQFDYFQEKNGEIIFYPKLLAVLRYKMNGKHYFIGICHIKFEPNIVIFIDSDCKYWQLLIKNKKQAEEDFKKKILENEIHNGYFDLTPYQNFG